MKYQTCKLNIPVLNQSSQKYIYATTLQDFTGGVTQVEKFILESDLEAARVFLLNDLKSKIPELFKDYLDKSFEENNIQLEVLNFDEAIEISNISYDIVKSYWEKLDGFKGKINAEIKAKAISIKDLENIARCN